MRREKRESGASLDSLLDTMTNVVGILVILLTVTQLGVGEAVKRIGDTESVRPEALEKAKLELLELQKQRELLRHRLEALTDLDSENAAQALQKLKREIADYEADLRVLTEGRDEKLLAESELRSLMEEAQAILDEQKKEAQAITGQINAGEDEVATLRAQLADLPELGTFMAATVTLPNPQPAPQGATEVTFLCREGKVLGINRLLLEGKAQQRAAAIISRRRLGRDPAVGIDGTILVEEFNSTPIEDKDFEVQLKVAGRTPKLVYQPQGDSGETIDEAMRGGSRFQTSVRRLDPRRNYIRFQVWPDSFAVYLVARQIVSERGLLAGWQPQTTPGAYTTNLGGSLKVGPPPAPKPKPPPGEEKPKPPRKPAPVDAID